MLPIFTARYYTERGKGGIAVASRPSVCLFVISPLISLESSLSTDPSNMDLLQREPLSPGISAGTRVGYRKVAVGVQNPHYL